MDVWIQWTMGPFFWTALAFMLFGLLRHLGLTLWEGVQAYRRAGDKDIPARRVLTSTLKWLVPVDRLANRWPGERGP